MSVFGFARIFTGVSADMRKLREVVKSSSVKLPSSREKPAPLVATSVEADLRLLSPCLSPSRTPCSKQLREEDDRWDQVEGGSPRRWRSCRGCSFLGSAQQLVCEVCGLRASVQGEQTSNQIIDYVCDEGASAQGAQTSNQITDDVSDEGASAQGEQTSNEIIDDVSDKGQMSRMSSTKSLREVVIADCASAREIYEGTQRERMQTQAPKPGLAEVLQCQQETAAAAAAAAAAADGPAAANVTSAHACDGASDAGEQQIEDSQSEAGEVIAGSLEEAPPIGTEVKVLYDDERWHAAVVTGIEGTYTTVLYKDGVVATVDVAVDAVRLADYVGDDEQSDWETEAGEHDHAEGNEREAADADVDDEPRRTHKVHEARNDDECMDQDIDNSEGESEDGEEVCVPGALDRPPPVGTMVKVLYDDDAWYLARIKAVDGVKAVVIYRTGDGDYEEELDFDENAVRHINYVDGNDECNEEDKTTEQGK